VAHDRSRKLSPLEVSERSLSMPRSESLCAADNTKDPFFESESIVVGDRVTHALVHSYLHAFSRSKSKQHIQYSPSKRHQDKIDRTTTQGEAEEKKKTKKKTKDSGKH